MTGATSTNTLGFIVWTVLLTVGGWVVTIAVNRWELKETWPEVMRRSYKPILAEAAFVVALVLCLWFVFVGRTIYADHQDLVKRVGDLQEYAKNKQNFDDQLRDAQSETKYWRNAYQALSRGDIHPDRNLNSEETNQLYEELRRVSNDPRNKDYIKWELGSVQDREATALGYQLLQVFNEAHWKIKPISKLGKEFNQNSIPIGITIWADDPGRGNMMVSTLKAAGLKDTYANPYPIPQGFKGAIIWVGYKQWP